MRCCVLLGMLCFVSAVSLCADEPGVTQDSANVDLSGVVDRTDLAYEESPAYYGLLNQVRTVPQAALAAAAQDFRKQRRQSSTRFGELPETEFPTFVDMIEHPQQYRGQPVTLQGHLIRLVKYPAGPNDVDIDTLYEAWLVTEHSQQHSATIICTEIPGGMPIGEEIINSVSVTGYFFKLHTYPSRDRKTRFAPMILAHEIQWNPPGTTAGGTLSPLLIYVGLAAVVLAISAGMWVIVQGRRRVHKVRHRESLPNEPPDFLKSLTP